MAKKRIAIVLEKLARESAAHLESMVSELSSEASSGSHVSVRQPLWGERFAASGKHKCQGAPRIRLS